jgi:hypothetical protein
MAGSDAKTPAPKKDKIYGSSKNPKGSASSGKSKAVKFSAKTETSLKNKVKEHNEKASDGRKATLGMLKAVYRRGAGAFSKSHRPGMTRDQWAMGRVNAFLKLLKSGRPANPKYVTDNDLLPSSHPKSSKKKSMSIIAAGENSCPPATQDIAINLKNRKNAIDTAMYGPLNPAEPNEEYWSKLGDEWGVSTEEAKKQRCGNCAVFIQTPSMKACIEGGLTDNADEFDAIDEAGELGYCEIFDFKCASARTCRAWVAGGPVTEEKDEYKEELTVYLKEEHEYSSPEEAIFALTEYLGFGYEAEPAIRAAWIRGVNAGESPYQRALNVAEYAFNSNDADLLPKIEKDVLS